MAAKRRTAILISGRGSNMTALIEAAKHDDFPAEIALVVSNRPDAAGLEAAAAAGIDSLSIDHKEFENREDFDARLSDTLESGGIELVCLAGFMRLLGETFVKRWRDQVINIHPSLLPAFKGVDTHARALEAGVRIAGCSVHFVRAEMDSGPVIMQAAVPVHQEDNEASLAARVLEAEHRIYPLALDLVASGRARVAGERVVIEGSPKAKGLLVSPAP